MTAAGFPGLLAQIAFTTPYTTLTPTWVDLSGRVRSCNTSRGRPGMFSQIEPGTAGLTLRNTDGALAADNPSGPYYGHIRPLRRTRLVATVLGTPYPFFTGYADKFSRGFDGVPTSQVTATDRFKLLAKFKSTASFSDESAATRLTNLLQSSGPSAGIIVPSTERSINLDGFTTRSVSTYDYDEFNTLQALQDIENADGGQLFVDGSGVLVYQSVKFRQIGGSTRARTSQARLGNDATSIRIEPPVEPRVDENLMANYITLTDCNSETPFAQDTTAQGVDGRIDADLGATLLLTTDGQDRVNDELVLRKAPTERYEQVVVNLLACTTAEQATVLGLEISDRVTIAIIQDGLTSGTQRDQWIEGIEHDVNIVGEPSWMVTFHLSSAGDAATVIP